MIQTTHGQVTGKNNQKISYTYIQPGDLPSATVAFFCPGASYLFDKPYLHYSTMLLLNHQCDIVHIGYEYGKENAAFWEMSVEERSEWIQDDVQAVVSRVLGEHSYERVLFLGKSIGTLPIVNGLLPAPEYAKAAAILLTPLLTVEQLSANLLAAHQPLFLAIGTADHFYNEHVVEQLRQSRPNVQLKIVPQANHALEIGWHARASISVLDEVMDEMDQFLQKL